MNNVRFKGNQKQKSSRAPVTPQTSLRHRIDPWLRLRAVALFPVNQIRKQRESDNSSSFPFPVLLLKLPRLKGQHIFWEGGWQSFIFWFPLKCVSLKISDSLTDGFLSVFFPTLTPSARIVPCSSTTSVLYYQRG